ncbi:hypothetical protein BJ085DRAFT_37237 [Dimargaris cristalligena]|uniref:Uncharacterized protein n=1 Tax=Dimargaris cristalligena TaxID=215637 RepID=A0A4Q0A2K2_9FUNG|nr:hypothetical protein BJ085DRAFT_37237 [Dimargaris cristalligena]|eukprot:RKP40343.1 hypothetical protein BJ085DRAFT_37237 [Dimargaris cristalligena]
MPGIKYWGRVLLISSLLAAQASGSPIFDKIKGLLNNRLGQSRTNLAGSFNTLVETNLSNPTTPMTSTANSSPALTVTGDVGPANSANSHIVWLESLFLPYLALLKDNQAHRQSVNFPIYVHGSLVVTEDDLFSEYNDHLFWRSSSYATHRVKPNDPTKSDLDIGYIELGTFFPLDRERLFPLMSLVREDDTMAMETLVEYLLNETVRGNLYWTMVNALPEVARREIPEYFFHGPTTAADGTTAVQDLNEVQQAMVCDSFTFSHVIPTIMVYHLYLNKLASLEAFVAHLSDPKQEAQLGNLRSTVLGQAVFLSSLVFGMDLNSKNTQSIVDTLTQKWVLELPEGQGGWVAECSLEADQFKRDVLAKVNREPFTHDPYQLQNYNYGASMQRCFKRMLLNPRMFINTPDGHLFLPVSARMVGESHAVNEAVDWEPTVKPADKASDPMENVTDLPHISAPGVNPANTDIPLSVVTKFTADKRPRPKVYYINGKHYI